MPGSEIGERIRIDDLVCPLRYDIKIRADFIAQLTQSDDLKGDDMASDTDVPAVRAYKTWFREIEIRRFYPELYDDEIRVRIRFDRRVRKLQRLWRSICDRGFISKYPIRLKSGNNIQRVNGKAISTSYFAGDGCHRLACLLVIGRDYLEPSDYVVEISDVFAPLDNTAILIRALPISRLEYLSFISRGYCTGEPLESADQALSYVENHAPQRLLELRSVLQYDLAQFERSQ